MPPRKEPCRNFLRGSCQYGERCKFLHVAQQQPKPNPFGFGSQPSNFQSTNLQQTKSNPYGFGVQNNFQPRGSNDLGPKQSQYKPFENKWTRSTSTNSSSSRQSDNQPVAPNHTCTDSDSCRRQIMEDFNNEKPMWLLTCYGHRKNGPCDVIGDVSYDELRAAAYDDAKRGQSLMSIVERERNMLNSKAAEFENLLRNYVAPSTSVPNAQSPFPGAAPNASLSAQSPFPVTTPNASLSAQSPFPGAAPNASLSAQSSFPPSASSFSQLGALLNTGASAAPTNTFGQPSPLGNSVKTSSSSSGANAFSFGNAGSFGFGSQVTSQSHQNPFTPSNISASSERNPFSTSITSQHFPNPSGGQLPTTPQGNFSASVAVSPVNINLTNAASTEEFSGDNSIWAKKEWKIGEIPEEAPPDKYIF
ncbi:zinc finger CCCH domain-containing protein 46 isoform X2 [Nicotiana tabacum]|uniref:Zinc finger CCCH domain-containing protein 16 isoform X2 n=2 Tax=Nicotiana TaxID=4085 RepID=A0A1S4C8A7_TOBAC|nr:PREDICTED: zinc finger CCCH domain-containing protein 16 isoform X2 [Nicotiana sylvestris]XP_016497477.1 PREDICTED: zinc finger CCCH domain-containing protein 16-like isoform X2 [Nicotiana tabacum]